MSVSSFKEYLISLYTIWNTNAYSTQRKRYKPEIANSPIPIYRKPAIKVKKAHTINNPNHPDLGATAIFFRPNRERMSQEIISSGKRKSFTVTATEPKGNRVKLPNGISSNKRYKSIRVKVMVRIVTLQFKIFKNICSKLFLILTLCMAIEKVLQEIAQ